MDSMAEQLENLLGDENTVAQLQRIVSSLREEGGGSAHGIGPAAAASEPSREGGSPAAIQPDMLAGMMRMLPGLMGGGSGSGSAQDPDLALLQALRPFLSAKRKKRAGEAVKLMKLMDMLPLLQQSGLLSGFLGGEEDE